VIPAFIFVIQTQFIVGEERFMEELFGEEYLNYKRRVRRWLSRVFCLRTFLWALKAFSQELLQHFLSLMAQQFARTMNFSLAIYYFWGWGEGVELALDCF